jgi:crotonobetaine/carnitine-CoA ligase
MTDDEAQPWQPPPAGVGYRRSGSDTVWSIIDRRVELSGELADALTFVTPGDSAFGVTWNDYRTRALALAEQLHGLGVRRGDRVALFGPNSYEYVMSMAATARLGAVVVPLNILLAPAELAFQLSDADVEVILCDPAGTDRVDQAAGLVGTSFQRVTWAEGAPGWEPMALDGGDGISWLPLPEPDDVFQIIYTSGTTARPKGTMLTHRAMVAEASKSVTYWAARTDDIFYITLPLYHTNAQILSFFPCVDIGARLVISRSFSASRWIDTVCAYDVTVSSVVGPQVQMLMAQPPKAIDSQSRLRCLPFGLNVARDVWTQFEERFGAPLVNIYGLTETVGLVSVATLQADRRIPSVGRPALDREVAVVDADGSPVPAGETGEIIVRGELGVTLMSGYHGQPEATAAAFVDGWFRTGDLGRFDTDGYLFFGGRAKDMIKRGGENIAALEVEQVLLDHPEVAGAAVIGRPDPFRGEAVVAFVVLAGQATADVEELSKHCHAHLAAFKVPEQIHVIAELPRNSIQKVDKKVLQARFAEFATSRDGV